MTSFTNVRTALTLFIPLLLGGVSLAACGDDSGEETPPEKREDAGGNKPSAKPDASVADGGKEPGKAGSGAGGKSGSNGRAGTGAGGTAAPTDGGIPDSGPTTCDEDDCPGAQCEPFDNQERIGHPDYVEGQDLPTDFP